MRLIPLCLLLAVAGCTLEDLRVRHVPEGPVSWRVGYADGCQSGRLEGRGHRPVERGEIVDRERMRTDDDYRAGWQKGFEECLQATREGPLAAEPTPIPPWVASPTRRPADAPPLPPSPEPAAETAPPAAPAAAPPPVPPLEAPAASEEPGKPAEPADAGRKREIEDRIRRLQQEIESLQKELE